LATCSSGTRGKLTGANNDDEGVAVATGAAVVAVGNDSDVTGALEYNDPLRVSPTASEALVCTLDSKVEYGRFRGFNEVLGIVVVPLLPKALNAFCRSCAARSLSFVGGFCI
jgi:hypothetical protein